MDYQSNIKDFLVSLGEVLKGLRYNKNLVILPKVSTFKLGLLPASFVYPALVVLPHDEIYQEFRSGGKFTVVRTVQIEGFIKDLKIKEAQLKATMLGEEVRKYLLRDKEIVKADATQRPLSYNTIVGEMFLGTDPVDTDWIIGKFALPVTFYCKDIISDDKRFLVKYVETEQDDVFDKVLYTLTKARQFNYPKVKSIYDTTLPVLRTGNLPAIFVQEFDSTEEQIEAGRDTITRRFQISVYTRAIAKTQLLWDNLSIIEGIKNVLLVNYRMDGLIKRLILDRSDFFIEQHKNNDYFYKTRISFNIECYRKTEFN